MADIKIQNLYYMLSYAYQSLREQGADKVSTVSFENIHDLFAAILIQGVGKQIKRGLHRDYIPREEELAGVRGQILVGESIKRQTQIRSRLMCAFDEYTPDSLHNRILRCTMLLLLRHGEVSSSNRKALRRLIAYFSEVTNVEPSAVRFDVLQYHRNNGDYRMLMSVCQLVHKGLLLTTDKGEHRLAQWIQDEAMHRLYERFVLTYFQRHHDGLAPRAAYVEWDLRDGNSSAFLPSMRTDITLTGNGKTLIIDTKYYSRTMALHYDRHLYHSGNIYQIYTYVKNKDTASDGSVSGVLLYAKTDEEITPDDDFVMGDNRISLRTLDLNCPWQDITAQLDAIAAQVAQGV